MRSAASVFAEGAAVKIQLALNVAGQLPDDWCRGMITRHYKDVLNEAFGAKELLGLNALSSLEINLEME